MFYTIYETTNLVNGKKYRGYHMTEDLEDGYLGSGSAITKAIDKYGKENFKKEILEFCNSMEEMVEREKHYVTKEWVQDKNNYNLQEGGRFKPVDGETSDRISKTLKERYKTMPHHRKGVVSEFRGKKIGPNKKLSETKKKQFASGEKEVWNKGKKTGELSEEHKKKLSEKLKGRKPWNTGKSTVPWNAGKDCTGVWKGRVAPNKGKKASVIECPHCKKMVPGPSNFKRWHGENCKQNLANREELVNFDQTKSKL